MTTFVKIRGQIRIILESGSYRYQTPYEVAQFFGVDPLAIEAVGDTERGEIYGRFSSRDPVPLNDILRRVDA